MNKSLVNLGYDLLFDVKFINGCQIAINQNQTAQINILAFTCLY